LVIIANSEADSKLRESTYLPSLSISINVIVKKYIEQEKNLPKE